MQRSTELVGLGLVLVLALALRWTSPISAEDLRPRPDALEYEEAARNLRDGQGYNLIVEGRAYPPRYPPGMSLLLLPLLTLYDAGPGTGVLVVLAIALVTVAATWHLARLAGGPVSGLVAAALVSLSPVHVQLSRAVMSDVPSSCAATFVVGASLAAAARPRASAAWFALGLGVGLSTLLRLSNGLLLCPAVAGAWLAENSPRSVVRRLAWLSAGLAVGTAPLLGYDSMRFGSPFRSGYDLWVPGRYFARQYVTGPPALGGKTPNILYYGSALRGLGDLYPWPVALLIAAGIVFGYRRGGVQRWLILLALALALPILGFYLCYYWQSLRFLTPLLPPLLAVAALPLSTSAPRWLRLAGVAAFATGLGILGRGPAWYAREKRFGEPTSLAAIDRAVPTNAALLLRTNETFFRRILRHDGADRLWLPLGLDDHQFAVRWNHVAPAASALDPGNWIRQGVDSKTALEMVGTVFAEGRPAYLATTLASQVPFMAGLLATLSTRYVVAPLVGLPNGDYLFQIVPRQARQ